MSMKAMGAQDADTDSVLHEERALGERSPDPSNLRKHLSLAIGGNSENSTHTYYNIDDGIQDHTAATQRVPYVLGSSASVSISERTFQSQTPVPVDPIMFVKEENPPLTDKTGSCQAHTKDSESEDTRFGVLRLKALVQYFNLKDLQPSEILFKAGALSYLLFVVKVFQNIWRMFWKQTLAFTVGHLALSVGVVVSIWFYFPRQIQTQYEQTSFPKVVINLTIFIGAFICVSISWSMLCIVKELVVLMLQSEHLL
ncbi:hypothetical protein EV361DRAFT_871018 [Lentinula raphanica]|nr:hypothetical protein EV361DRAFT_871018 [Lentinula raphanica]